MTLSQSDIIDQLKELVDATQIDTDADELKRSSIDRFRRFEGFHGVYRMPTPAAIVFVTSTEEVERVLSWANENEVNVVPRTGRSATEGGLETAKPNSIVLDGSRMNKILNIDIENMQATVQCGVPLAKLDDALRSLGYTTGHSPQSKPLAQYGGLVATRSIGQLSTLYGGIEDMVVGLEAVFPNIGTTRIKSVPRRAAGPDIRHIIIGNEGALCFITEVTVKIFKHYPEHEQYLGFTLDSMKTGFKVLRDVMAEGYRPSVARLYDVEDGAYHFSHFAKDKCVLVFLAEGPPEIARATADAINRLAAQHDECKPVKTQLIKDWFTHLNWDPSHLEAEKKEIIETKNICNTTEISADWGTIHDIYEVCMKRVREEIPHLTLLGGHSSHSYLNGTNLYFVYFYDVKSDIPEGELDDYHLPIKKIIVEETIKRGGSMCHHHGVGKHRTPWVKDEYGSSYPLLEGLKTVFDPNGIMNFGTIYPAD